MILHPTGIENIKYHTKLRCNRIKNTSTFSISVQLILHHKIHQKIRARRVFSNIKIYPSNLREDAYAINLFISEDLGIYMS